MGKYENELAAIVHAPDWTLGQTAGTDQVASLHSQLGTLQTHVGNIAASPGWEGASADSAKESFHRLRKNVIQAEDSVASIRSAIAGANHAKHLAKESYDSLPPATVPPAVHAAALAGGTIFFPGLGTIAAEVAVEKVQEFMGGQREAQAKKALDTLNDTLADHTATLSNANADLGGDAGSSSADKQSSTQIPSGSAGGSVTPPTYKPTPAGPGGQTTPVTPIAPSVSLPPIDSSVPPDDTTPSVDNSMGGGVTGTNGGAGSGGRGGGAAGTIPGLGLGIGGGVAAAGIGAATRFGGTGGLSGAAGLGGSATSGSGGLLGQGAKGGAGAAAEEGSAGSGGRGGTSMMGGGSGGGAQEKDKRAGLGGIIAPKLEDDEETGPRSAGTLAGGRNTSEGK